MKLKILVNSVIFSLMFSLTSMAIDTITWGTTATFKAYASDGITLLPGNALSSIGGFVQLIYLGTDNIYNGFVSSGTGVQGDDVVAQTSWIGGGVMAPLDGRFTAIYASSYAIGSRFEIRFFDTTAADYALGTVPGSGNYGLSQVFISSGDPALGGTDTFYLNANYSATTPVVAVPEPSTVALMLAGLGVLGFARMRRK